MADTISQAEMLLRSEVARLQQENDRLRAVLRDYTAKEARASLTEAPTQIVRPPANARRKLKLRAL